jgi:2-C-methyl-D-erythritol 4-phosphate cytidylyltransferase
LISAIILSGGTGSRINSPLPKQYIKVANKPIICYCLETFQNCNLIDEIIIVADKKYFQNLREQIDIYKITKFKTFAESGESRQHSIYNGISAAILINPTNSTQNNSVIVHDSARPLVTIKDIENVINSLNNSGNFDGITPVLPVKDTIYTCKNGEIVSLLDRDTLFAGQTPEIYNLEKYFNAHKNVNLSEIRGSSELAIKAGMRIGTCPGNENNFKITTDVDLKKFEDMIKI